MLMFIKMQVFIKKTLCLFCVIIISACFRDESVNNESSGVPANYSYFCTVIVGEGGIVSCLPTGLPNSACKSITERMDGIPFKVNKGSSAILKAIPNDGYLFSGWPNGSDELTTIVHFDADVSITVSFSLIEAAD